MDSSEIKAQIAKGLSANEVIVVESEDNVHFYATVVSSDFEDKNQVARQRKIYEILGDKISSGEVHALSLKTYTPKEWEDNNA